MKSLSIFLIVLSLFSTALIAQNVEAKLGSGGTFSVLSSSNSSMLSISENDNLLNLVNLNIATTSGSNSGIIYKGGLSFFHTFGTNNLFLGYNSGNFTLSNSSNGNIGIGTNTLLGLTTGIENTAVGNAALVHVTTGNYNSAFGSFALEPNTTGEYNSAFGYSSLRSNTEGTNNAAFGVGALYSNKTGTGNAAFGNGALFSNIGGLYNSAFGMNALRNNIRDENSAFGKNALFENTTGAANSAFGVGALVQNTTGNFNTAIGYLAGSNVTTGTNLVLIGNNSQPSSPSATNQITLGNSSITSLRCNVTSITSLSDARDKKNIKDLTLGLDFIRKIKPREFNWDKREWYQGETSDGSKMEQKPTAGFIAQELDEIQTKENAEWLKLVLKDNPEKLEATYGNLLPVMVKAIQDLANENDQLRKELSALKEVKVRLAKLEDLIIGTEVKFSSNISK